MRAIVIDGSGGVEHLVIKEIPEPEPKPGHALIKVMAFGINRAEMHMFSKALSLVVLMRQNDASDCGQMLETTRTAPWFLVTP